MIPEKPREYVTVRGDSHGTGVELGEVVSVRNALGGVGEIDVVADGRDFAERGELQTTAFWM